MEVLYIRTVHPGITGRGGGGLVVVCGGDEAPTARNLTPFTPHDVSMGRGASLNLELLQLCPVRVQHCLGGLGFRV